MNKKQTVLIVEDEEVNRKLLYRLLIDKYDVLEAENGQVALEIVLSNRYELSAILLDLIMPVTDGYEFMRQLREKNRTDIPIVVMTGEKNVETERKALEAGAWDFVFKPYDRIILDIRLRNAIARNQAVLYQKINHLMEHDSLTGLHNREKMFANTRKMVDKNPNLKFAFLRGDIDHFVLYNTSFGEAEGDKLIIYFSKLVQEFCDRYSPCTYGRISADIFCACVAWSGNYDALEKQLQDFNHKLDEFRKEYVLEVSVGVCEVDQTLSIDEMYYRAALGTKKCKYCYGKYMGVYDEAEVKQEEEAIQIANEMETALKDEQFVVYLQPKYKIAGETLCGAEALVRWIHPVKGLVSPGIFIPVFEKNGFISKLDSYMWEHTCKILAKWLENGVTPKPVSVNVSRISLYNPNLDQEIRLLVDKYNIPPSLLEIEITESAYMTNPVLMQEMVTKLHKAGFTILMDDFGSGYSSLNSLKDIEIDVLKIDMKFIPKDDEAEKGNIILGSVIDMAKNLGMSVIAEGVETEYQKEFLVQRKCDMIQGFYYSKPLSLEKFENTYMR